MQESPNRDDVSNHAEHIAPEPLTLDELLRGVTDDILPGEWDTGPAVGREVW